MLSRKNNKLMSKTTIKEVFVMFELKLREYRKSLGLSQRDVAIALNMSQQGYWRWENGTSFPNGEKIIELCKLFKCTPNDLFGIHGVYSVAMAELDQD